MVLVLCGMGCVVGADDVDGAVRERGTDGLDVLVGAKALVVKDVPDGTRVVAPLAEYRTPRARAVVGVS